MMSMDAVFLQRAFIPDQVGLGNLAKEHGKPVITDYDDFLFAVQEDNPTHITYSQHASKSNVELCCRMSDVLTVSTEELKQKLLPFNENIVVVPNAIDFDLVKPMSPEIPRNPLVVWRGGSSHQEDFREHTDAILDAHDKFPNYHFAFVGFNPWWITKRMDQKRFRVLPFDGSYVNYMRNLCKLRGAIHIVPLADNVFNRCKSNISVLEATVAGSVVLAPDWEEFRTFGTIPYQDKASFHGKLLELMATPHDNLAAINKPALEQVKQYRNLDLMNKIRVETFRKYAGMR